MAHQLAAADEALEAARRQLAQQVAAERQLMQAVHEAEEATLPGPEQREARLSGKACEAAAATPLRELTVQAFAPSPPMSISPGVAARSTERTDADKLAAMDEENATQRRRAEVADERTQAAAKDRDALHAQWRATQEQLLEARGENRAYEELARKMMAQAAAPPPPARTAHHRRRQPSHDILNPAQVTQLHAERGAAIRMHDAVRQRCGQLELEWEAFKEQRNEATARLATVQFEKRQLLTTVHQLLQKCTASLTQQRTYTLLTEERQAIEHVKQQLADRLAVMQRELGRDENALCASTPVTQGGDDPWSNFKARDILLKVT